MGTLHHIGYAVRSMEDSQNAFEALGAQFFHSAYDEERNLDFSFAYLGGDGMIELISPHDPEKPCTVSKMIEKQPCTQYHFCLKVDDLNEEIKRLRALGFMQMGKIIHKDIYGYDADGVFLYSKGTGTIELVAECKTDV